VIVPLGDASPESEAFDLVAATLSRGGVVGIPTDTVYGLAALPGDADAMRTLFDLKGRSGGQSIAVLVADVDQAQTLSAVPIDRFAPFWPGPLTVVVPRAAEAQLHLGGDERTVGVRCPDHSLLRRLAAKLGPIAATSANRSGEATLTSANAVAAQFPELAVVVDGGVLGDAASTVVDATVDPPVILRAGPILASELGL